MVPTTTNTQFLNIDKNMFFFLRFYEPLFDVLTMERDRFFSELILELEM